MKYYRLNRFLIKSAFFLLSISLSLDLSAQVDLNNPPWLLPCDTLTSQTEMNICSYQKYKVADSLLLLNYKTLISYFEKRISFLSNKSVKSEKISRKFIRQLKTQEKTLLKSFGDFHKCLERTILIGDYEYAAGTISPLVKYTLALEITINQIEITNKLIEEIIGPSHF
jgi:hypothetical protein